MSSKLSPKKINNKPQIKKSDVDFYKMSFLFFLLCGVVLLILNITTTLSMRQASGRNTAFELYTLFNSIPYIAVVGILLVSSVIWYIVCRVRKVNEELKVFSSLDAVVLMLYTCFFSLYFGKSVVSRADDCYFVLVATGVLALIYYVSKIYHRDFLIFTIENALLSLLLYKYWHVFTAKGVAGKILIAVAFAVLGIVFVKYAPKLTSRLKSSKKGTKNKPLCFPYFVSLVLWAVFMFIRHPSLINMYYKSAGVDLAALANPENALFAENMLKAEGVNAFLGFMSSGTMITVLFVQYLIFAIVYTIKLIRE